MSGSSSGWQLRRCTFMVLLALGTIMSQALPAAAPELATLQKVSESVQKQLSKTQAAVVAIECHEGTGSGVIVSPSGLVLTAAHVTRTPGTRVTVRLLDGTTVSGESLGVDHATDAGMLQLPKGTSPWPYVPMQKQLGYTQMGDWCYALGHPGGFDLKRGPVLRLGKVLKISANRLQSDCVLMGGDSGGALFNLKGELIGVHSQIWEGRDQNIHVNLAPYLRSWTELQNKAVIRIWDVGTGAYLGVKTLHRDGKLWVQALDEKGPAALAGVKQGDQLVALDGVPLVNPIDLTDQILLRPVSSLISLTVQTQTQDERIVDVQLTQRPSQP